MKIELNVYGPAVAALVSEFLPRYMAAVREDEASHLDRYGLTPATEADLSAVPPQEEPKAKRSRKTAEKQPEPAPEPVPEAPEAEPAIRATPEDRQPVAEVEQIEEAEVVVGTPTLDDLKAAMAKVQEVRGMDWLVKNVQALLGAPRASAVADEDRAAAIARLEEAARG